MRYPVFIEPGTDEAAFGVVVPDLPGCFSAGDTLDEALSAAEEAATAWIDAALDQALPIPAPTSAEAHLGDYPGWLIGVVTVNLADLDDTTERVNITLPRRVLARLDTKAREAGETRSGFIARMAAG